ncbi:MAG: site-2 protease family protein [Patescibacteria group bacterium]
MQGVDTLFFIVILIMSVVIHEVSHGFAAYYFGDKTALYAGRLTLNPLKHLDMFGSVILPFLLVIIKAPFLFGWAKPVPYNPENFENKKLGTLAVASAGILSNIFLAVVFGLLMRLSLKYFFSPDLLAILSLIVMVNLGLAIFNLMPVPPLDGSKILFELLPRSMYSVISFMERYALFLILLFIVFFADYLYPILSYFYTLITGLAI